MCVPLQQRNHSSQIVVLILARIPEVFFSRILQIPKLADLQMDNVSDNASEMPAELPWQLLEEITNGFSKGREIGRGGFGVVYKGVYTNGEEIAVKKFYQWLLDDKQFQNELQKLTILRHQNIVRLVGKSYVERDRCVEHEGKLVCAIMIDRAICLEYLDNGSLEKHLCDEYSGLSWHCRYKIIQGICDGLKYLHGRGIFHLDLKPANILLDKNMVPKIADFDLSRLFSGTRQSHTTSKFSGTLRYMPPEYIKQGKISEKFDVFSLGVIIIAIMTGPEGYSKQSDMSSQDFIEQVLENWRNRPQEQLKDKSYLDVFCQQVKICIEIALNCVETDRHKRPSIEDIISKMNESETMIEKSDKINKLKAQLEEADLGSKVPRTEMRSLGPSYMSREPSSSFSEAAEDDPLPAIEGLRITGETFPGRELEASGFSINGTTSCNFEWVRHLEDGSVNFIEGAREPTYLVTADDVDSLLAVEVQPLDDRKRKGEIVEVYANEQRKIICDPETKELIKKILSIGHVSYEVLRPVRFLDMWEPAVLAIKREGYSIKCNGERGVVITEKFQQATAINIPYGLPTEFSIQSADGAKYNIKPAENAPSRDTIVLILRVFRMKVCSSWSCPNGNLATRSSSF